MFRGKWNSLDIFDTFCSHRSSRWSTPSYFIPLWNLFSCYKTILSFIVQYFNTQVFTKTEFNFSLYSSPSYSNHIFSSEIEPENENRFQPTSSIVKHVTNSKEKKNKLEQKQKNITNRMEIVSAFRWNWRFTQWLLLDKNLKLNFFYFFVVDLTEKLTSVVRTQSITFAS